MNQGSAVIDTNLILSALIPKSSKIRDTLFDENLTFYAPNFLITEFYKHKEKLLKYSKLNEEEFFEYFSGIINRINFVPIDSIKTESRKIAYNYCKGIDVKDTPFVALAIELKLPIWTGDKKLKEGLKELGFKDFWELG
jgi:predicted nucleic acid-binding protein